MSYVNLPCYGDLVDVSLDVTDLKKETLIQNGRMMNIQKGIQITYYMVCPYIVVFGFSFIGFLFRFCLALNI